MDLIKDYVASLFLPLYISVYLCPPVTLPDRNDYSTNKLN